MAGIIHVLDSETIDKIAAGEVVEKPASVVKELVENSIDAKADKITVEIKEGGTSLIRVTDNGCGIDQDDLKQAFLRHATSKIESVDDLNTISSLGFRGEALSSISAVSQVEMITKKQNQLMGLKICCNGGVTEEPEEIGAPDGTTVLVRNLFYNTPVRKKFLHTSATEGSYISELMQHIALSHPEVSISFIQNGQTKFFTSGNGELSDVIYRIYGKDVVSQMIPIQASGKGVQISGYIGKPILGRANRNYEIFFVNGRYIRSKVISSALEEGYKTFLMQHKYPFAILHFTINGSDIDINVHPTKMEIRIMQPIPFCEFVKESVRNTLDETAMIRDYNDDEHIEDGINLKASVAVTEKKTAPEPFEVNRIKQENIQEDRQETRQKNIQEDRQENIQEKVSETAVESVKYPADEPHAVEEEASYQFKILGNPQPKKTMKTDRYSGGGNIIKERTPVVSKAVQMEMFADALDEMDESKISELKIIGQVFQTYWIVEFENNLYFVDQHAAHEKVNYENFMEKLNQNENETQMLMPPRIVSLTPVERNIYDDFEDYFAKLGFEIEPFGGNDLTIRGIPTDLYGAEEKELFLTILDELGESPVRGTPDIITAKIASMACKAAVKGNQELSYEEAKALLQRLFALDNPYHCPHGRPTMFKMSRQEIDKKIKRT